MPLIYAIDDDKDILRLIKTCLKKKHFEVSTYFNWQNAYNAIKVRRPQLILLDVFLAYDHDGLDVCQKFKASPYSRNIPVVIISAYPSIAESAVHEYGADDFIAKPFDKQEMIKKINSLLLKKRRGNYDSPVKFHNYHM